MSSPENPQEPANGAPPAVEADAADAAADPAEPPNRFEDRVIPFEFTGSGSEYFRIWIVNVALTIVTLGVYSAWAKQRTRQYLYGHTLLDGSSFEYLADPLKILRGRVVAVALTGVFVAIEAIWPAALFPLFLLFWLVSPALGVLALRFNARNSAWRNVRFHFVGGGMDAIGTVVKGGFASAFTCGLGAPYAQWLWMGFVAGNYRFGNIPVAWRTKLDELWQVYLRTVVVWLVGFFGLIVFELMGGNTAAAQSEAADPPLALLFGFYAIVFFLGAYLRAALGNLYLGGMTIGDHDLRSEMRFRDMAFILFTNLVALVVTLGMAWPWAKIRLVRYRFSRLHLIAHGPLLVQADPSVGDDTDAGAIADAGVDFGDLDLDLGF